jgi:hypothetical protein
MQAMKIFSSLKSERTARNMYRSRHEPNSDVFDHIARFYNPKRRHLHVSQDREHGFHSIVSNDFRGS